MKFFDWLYAEVSAVRIKILNVLICVQLIFGTFSYFPAPVSINFLVELIWEGEGL